MKNGRYSSVEDAVAHILVFVIKCYLPGRDILSAKIRKDLELAGTPIGANDVLIAAAAVHEKATLITHNTDEFPRVPDLKIEDWVEE